MFSAERRRGSREIFTVELSAGTVKKILSKPVLMFLNNKSGSTSAPAFLSTKRKWGKNEAK